MSAPIRVAVLGAPGRMGMAVCAAVREDLDLELVAGIGRNDPLSVVIDRGAEVAVDFTTPGAVKENVRFLLEHGVHAVVGTSGLHDRDLEEIARWVSESRANAFVAPNFAVGAVLMMSFAASAARYFDRAEIVERHHERKLDSPSGTALRTAALMNAERSAPWQEGREDGLPWRGGNEGGVRIHSLRLPGSVAHQEVVLGSAGETLSIRHDSIDRSSFMPGVVLAIKAVGRRSGLTVGLEALLEL
ncbi:MAG TPA: 4-hydroxy-tetrahydrodipicolinate reductase [Actinomycetota bacterium]|nr:4-hydroxy-tetrahydrodipicolinate reductase [Actinomycetota bacterium]